jgi:hypothetical protein
VFTSLTVPTAPFGIIKGLSGHPGGELWAVSDNGRAYRRPVDAGFVEITGFTSGFADVYVAPNGAVFMVSTPRTTRTCLSNCTTQAAFTDYMLPTANLTVTALCGDSSTNVFAVGKRDVAGIGVLYRWNGTNWYSLSGSLGVDNPTSCYLRSDGVLTSRAGRAAAPPSRPQASTSRRRSAPTRWPRGGMASPALATR